MHALSNHDLYRTLHEYPSVLQAMTTKAASKFKETFKLSPVNCERFTKYNIRLSEFIDTVTIFELTTLKVQLATDSIGRDEKNVATIDSDCKKSESEIEMGVNMHVLRAAAKISECFVAWTLLSIH